MYGDCEMIREHVVVRNPSGLHLRPAARLSETALQFSSRVTLLHEGSEAKAKSVLGIRGACVKSGDTVTVVCDGPDEEAAMWAVLEVLQDT